MTRFMLTMGCCLVVFALIAQRAAAQASEPATQNSEAAAEKPDADAQEPEEPAETPDAGAEKPEEATKPDETAAAEPQQKGGPEATAEQKPAMHTVKPELLKIEVSLKGSFEAQSMTEIVLRPEVWSSFEVLKAVEHGALVERGDRLVEFEMKDIDDAIADQRAKVELGELAVKQAEESLAILEESTPLDLADAERSKHRADEDFARFLKVERPMNEKSANFNVETSEDYLEYEKEELRQLEKMYKADDLTEETEEIILKRQRDTVKRAEFYLELDKLRRDETLGVTLPRLEESMKVSLEREKLELDEAKATLPLALRRTRLELEKLKVQLTKEEERLKELETDRAMMTVEAPSGGILYYGRFNRGEWSGASAGAEKLRRGGSVSGNDVFMTIVKPRPMVIRLKVPEKHLHQIRPGLKGTVVPTGFPDLRLAATVAKVGGIPFTAGNFEAQLKVNVDEQAEALMPGMSCDVKFIPYLNRRALTVPPSAVSTDELDDQKHYVYLVAENGEQKKRRVAVGQKTEDQVEIVMGLEEGDQVLKEVPKDKK